LTGDGFKNVTVDSQLSAGNEIIFVGDFEQVDVLADDALLEPKRQK